MQPVPLTPDSLPLRDIHLPPQISWWPPAPGWWLLLLVFATLFIVLFWTRQYSRRRRFKRLALSRLTELEQQYQEQTDARQLQQSLSYLLRQSAILHFPHDNCAGLIDEAWLNFLDQPLDGKPFSQGVGQLLSHGPYRPQAGDSDVRALLELCRNWVQRLPPLPKKQRRMQ